MELGLPDRPAYFRLFWMENVTVWLVGSDKNKEWRE